ncbi:MAG: hypothetical protein WC505_04645 [Patescibacteria group bacterium]
MEQQKKKAIYIWVMVGIVVILIGVVMWIQFFREAPVDTVPAVNQPTNTIAANVTVVNATEEPAPADEEIDAVETEELTVTRLAILFAERFGSYSTDAAYENISNLKGYMTASMQNWADQYVADQRELEADSYFAIVTKARSTKVVSLSDDAASVAVTAQRTPDELSGLNSPFIQTIVIGLSHDGEAWLVESAVWQDQDLGE